MFNVELKSIIIFQQVRITKNGVMLERIQIQNGVEKSMKVKALHSRAFAEVLMLLEVDGKMLAIKLNINPIPIVALQKIWEAMAVQ